jgi:hypothetical protein
LVVSKLTLAQEITKRIISSWGTIEMQAYIAHYTSCLGLIQLTQFSKSSRDGA